MTLCLGYIYLVLSMGLVVALYWMPSIVSCSSLLFYEHNCMAQRLLAVVNDCSSRFGESRSGAAGLVGVHVGISNYLPGFPS